MSGYNFVKIDFELIRGRPGSKHSEQILAVGKGGTSDQINSHQVTVAVYAELCPNDQVKIRKILHFECSKLKAQNYQFVWENILTRKSLRSNPETKGFDSRRKW